jgi:hypothetical protein
VGGRHVNTGGQAAAFGRLPFGTGDGASRRRPLVRLPGWAIGATGLLALLVILAGVSAVALFASAGSHALVARGRGIPLWEAGPLHSVLSQPIWPRTRVAHRYSELIAVLTCAYAVAMLAARRLPLKALAGFVVVVSGILLLSPPLPLNDIGDYLGYARLAGLHGLNPYTHVMYAERQDPAYQLATWRNLSSPYGPLFTILTIPLAWLPLPTAYWVLKVAIIGLSLGFLWLVASVAARLHLDPRLPVLFVVANPIYLFYEVGGFHNDFLMLVPSMAAVLLLIARRDRAAGAVLMLAVAVKFTSIVLLPFLLVAAGSRDRRLRVLTGALLAAVPLAAITLSLFGTALPNLADQSRLVTGYSIPNLTGLLLGSGGSTPALVRAAEVGVVLVVVWGVRRVDWLASAGWATVALIGSIAWLMPWYIVWALPLAAVASSRALRAVVLAFSVFLLASFLPDTAQFMRAHDLNPMSSRVDRAAVAFSRNLERAPGWRRRPQFLCQNLARCSVCLRSEAPTAWSATTPSRSCRPPVS